MATMRLVPSSYEISNTSITVTDAANAYNNTDNTTYARFGTTSTSSRYVYYRGFNFGSLPTGAVVSSFTIKYKAYESTMSTSSSYRPRIVNGTTTLTGSSTAITTSTVTDSFTGVTDSWGTISGYGSDFGIRFTVRRSGNSGTGYLYLYGCEIEVTYTVPEPVTITSTLEGDGTIVPSGATSLNKGEEYTITITPTDSSEPVTVTNNGVDVTSELIPPGSEQEDRVLGTYSLVSGGFNGSGATYFQGLVGKGVGSTTTTSNYYSSGSSTIAVFTYDMSFDVPAGATITRVWCQVNGHAESTSQSSEYMCAQLISGSTNLSSELNFKSIGTSNSTQTLEATTLPTVAQLAQMKLQCRLGYYGGAINGATAYVTFETQGYIYTYVTTGDATIAVVIGTPGPSTAAIYYKNGSTWVKATAVYKKVNGSWVLQTNLSNVFQTGVNYVKGN